MSIVLELTQMSAEQLAQALRETERELDDVLEERSFTLGQTGVHIGARELARLRASWDSDEKRLQQLIAAIRERLAELAVKTTDQR